MGQKMMACIGQQPEVWDRILKNRQRLCQDACGLWSKGKRVLIVGSGSSYNAALCAQRFYEDELKMETAVATSTAAVSKAVLLDPKSTQVIVVSQSGRSTNTEAVVASLKAAGFQVIGVTANAQSAIAQSCQAHLTIDCAEEPVPAKTKGMTATVLTLYMLGLQAAVTHGRISEREDGRVMGLLQAACGAGTENIRRSVAFCQKHLTMLANQPHYTLIADGAGIPVAMESALKMLETLYVPAAAYEFEEYLHGIHNTMSHGRAHFFLPTHPEQLMRMRALMHYSDDRGCLNWQVSTLDAETDERTLALLGSGSPYTAIFETMLFFQVLSSMGSDHLGINCDSPRYADFYDVMNTKSKQ